MIAPAPDRRDGGRRACAIFERRVGRAPAGIVRAPGRVNLIGEHTDYHDGFVLPMAIDRAVWLAFAPTGGPTVRVHAADLDEDGEIDLDNPVRGGPAWLAYIAGVAWVLAETGVRLEGWTGVLAGDVPRGAGLSSSAAVELAAARACAAASGLAWDPVAMAQAARRAEHEWVGMHCGIMDQLVVAAAREDHALLIDCRTLALAHVPVAPDAAVLVLDTGTRRGLTGSPYNERRRQSEKAARRLGVSALRDVTPAALDEGSARLDAVALRRARHIVSENARVGHAAAALRRGDLAALGRLMDDSHRSLRDDFEVSSPALDVMVACARDAGCYGARMTGAGFGGCAVALVDRDAAAAFASRVARTYRSPEGHAPGIYVCRAADGASITEALG